MELQLCVLESFCGPVHGWLSQCYKHTHSQMELNDDLFRLTDVCTEAIYPDAMIADCYIYLFNLADRVREGSKREKDTRNCNWGRSACTCTVCGRDLCTCTCRC